jgi:carbon starvation protein
LTGVAAWTTHYSSWAAANGLAAKVIAVVDGSANMIATLGIPKGFGVVIMGVFVASFAGTTLDSATRIQRYVIAELFGDIKLTALSGKYAATGIAVVSAAILAFVTGASGAGAMTLWPLFGATNQTLAALALVIIALYLHTKGGAKWMVAGLPAIFMAVMTIWALVINQVNFLGKHNMLLTVINICIIIVAVWIVIEGVAKFFTPPGSAAVEPEAAS